jgi:predicted TIM-barrel fold metal-dependent hydrolase
VLIDVHAHYFPETYIEAVRRFGGRAPGAMFEQPTTDTPAHVEARLRLMDEAGVQLQILSPNAVMPYAPVEADGVAAARAGNDAYAALVARYPERFAAFVSLPLPHIDASLREMARGLDELGMVGVHLNCSVFDRSTAEAEFEPLYAEMDRRGAVLFFHPSVNGICSPLINDYRFATSVGTSLEDTVIGLHLIARKIPTRYPSIKIIIPHFGGILPMLLERLDNQAAPVYPDLAERPSVTARRFFYDTVGHGSQAALLAAWKAFGAGHLVPGSDYPVLLPIEGYAQTFNYIRQSDLPPDDIEQILHRTAPALFGFTD